MHRLHVPLVIVLCHALFAAAALGQACCIPNTGSCLPLSSLPCVQAGGVPVGSSCTPNPCTGACCLSNGTCQYLTAPACTSAGYTYHGDFTTCTGLTCPVIGACCFPGGSCIAQSRSSCIQLIGPEYAGDGTVCTPAVCAFGACCASVTACASHLLGNCSGIWEGASTVCSPNPCDLTGRCCNVTTGACTTTSQSQCIGSFTSGGSCSPTFCPQPTGACCAADGACTVTLTASCTGMWTLGGNCSPNVCVQPTGACCLFHGNCQLSSQANCLAIPAGYWVGAFTTCTASVCSTSGGGCCNRPGFGSGQNGSGPNCAWFVGTEPLREFSADCSAQGGVWAGYGTSCLSTPPYTCQSGACCLGAGCIFSDASQCSVSSGTWWGINHTCNPSPCAAEGSCCSGTACTVVNSGNCAGTWTNSGTCSPNPCAPATGACCSGSTCSTTTGTACTGANTRFAGSGIACNASGSNSTPCCKANFNQSTATPAVTVQDIFDFLHAWFAHDPASDFNASGSVTVQDIFDFLAAWFARCP